MMASAASPANVALVLWVLWFASWMAAAGWSSAAVARQPAAARLRHGVLVGLGAYFLFGYAQAPLLHRPLLPLPWWAGWAAVAMMPLGFAYSWWARIHIGRLWSGAVTLKAGHTIVRSGPYAFTRHPIYTGLLVAAAATAVVFNQVQSMLGFALMTAGFVVKLRQEERLLERHFGHAYRDYRSEVKALVPGIW